MFHLERLEVMQQQGMAFKARRILVATDLDAASEDAIRAADAWAKLKGSEVLACHVGSHLERGDPLSPQRTEMAEPRSDPLAEHRSAVRHQFRSVLGRRGEDVPVYIASGEPGPGIAAVTEALRPDLLVVGAPRGLGLKRLLLGSVAEDVVRLTRCAVLIVRPATGHGGILVAADLSDDPLCAVQTAAIVSRTISGRVTVVHALSAGREPQAGATVEPASMPSHGWWGEAGGDDRLDAPALPALLQRLGVEGEARIYREDPVGAVLETAQALRPELCVVAMDASGRSIHGGLGSAARILIHAGTCSVLVVRPARATA